MSKRIPIFLGLILLAIAVWLQITSIVPVVHFITRLESLAYDVQLRTKFLTHHSPLQNSIAIVDIDDKSLGKEGRWPWPRAKIAALVDRLKEQGAVVIAFDILFAEKEENIATQVLAELDKQQLASPAIKPVLQQIEPFFDNDAKLAKSLAQSDTVLGISFLPRPEVEGFLAPPILTLTTPQEKQLGFINAPGVIGMIPALKEIAKNDGFINVFPDEDGIIRRVPILLRFQDGVYPSLALAAVKLYLLTNISITTAKYSGQMRIEGVKLGDNIIPTDDKAQVIVPFRGKSFTFPFYSATDVLQNKVARNALEGKIVFVGTSATGLGDLKATAIQNIFPGVEIQATIADGILAKNFSYKPAWSFGVEIFLTVFIGLILVFIFPHLGPRTLSLLIVAMPLIFIFTNNWLWDKTGLIISVFIPMSLSVILAIVNMIYGYLFETRRRERLKEMFGQYVPAKHIDEMLTSSSDYGLYGEDRDMTVLFADIRDFTTISEPLTASQLKELLNDFFTPMTEVIFKYRGTIDKYVGDLIMAFWGAPLKDKRHAQHALSAALDMQLALAKLNTEFADKGHTQINIGIGLNSGIMSVGDMGSKFRRNYTVLGDEVNLASRVEGLTKYYDVKIIATEHTQHHQKNFLFRKLDRVRVKGKKNGIEIYEPICRLADASTELLKEVEHCNAALMHYFAQEWEQSQAIFTELNKMHPHTKLYTLYLHRLIEFAKTPPPKDWDGVYTHITK